MNKSALPQPKTDAVVEGVPMRGALVEYREAQVAALERFAGEQERTIAKLVEALRNLHKQNETRLVFSGATVKDVREAGKWVAANDAAKTLLAELEEAS